jgi:TetR/AcrR family transcriptional repressor of nem operon
MRYSAAHKARTHRKIVSKAARLLRRDGIDGVSVAGVMREAGLTHGGFYAHFPSKDALLPEALEAAFAQTMRRLQSAAEDQSEPLRRLDAVLQTYLSETHRDRPDIGCPVAALGPEIARMAGACEAQFANAIEDRVELLQPFLAGDRAARETAIGIMSLMLGALVTARAVRSVPLSNEVLRSAQRCALRLATAQAAPLRGAGDTPPKD